ncbi:Rieske 2Fe-2S domain-containing protein [Georgenia sp. TF02-10]|uniref:Rieske 2Fe-2S domain-containing protein n=1 Tax=Georgenia sp. TF02-10 TaxID=2917725 RepID=UPI001FA80E3C|nr:Rieske 2Fe-2S domain-containing protein [Georgenia sp. TF02-10]UNX54003.1 Rieske 2Fe-2S domain-containing protein [Georgenia sp. TF02-10]
MSTLIERLENSTAPDAVAKPLQRVVRRLVQPRWVRNTLSGTFLGHPLHPALTDVPIGTWLAAAVLDTVGGRSAARGAALLVGTGIVAAVPTALSGLNDWSDTHGAASRVGVAHASANTVALALYGASLAARARCRRGPGRALGYAGLAAVLSGASLGGYLAYTQGINVNRTAFEHRPTTWTPVAADGDVGEGQSVRVDAAGAPVMLHRSDGNLQALAATCTHLGGPLEEGEVKDGCVTCPWHGSTFRLEDGSIVRGPASAPQPTYDTRVVDGRVEVRATR